MNNKYEKLTEEMKNLKEELNRKTEREYVEEKMKQQTKEITDLVDEKISLVKTELLNNQNVLKNELLGSQNALKKELLDSQTSFQKEVTDTHKELSNYIKFWVPIILINIILSIIIVYLIIFKDGKIPAETIEKIVNIVSTLINAYPKKL